MALILRKNCFTYEIIIPLVPVPHTVIPVLSSGYWYHQRCFIWKLPKNAPKSRFLGKFPFLGKKMYFTQKQKLFQKLWAVVKQMKKYFFSKILFGGGACGVPKLAKKPKMTLFKNTKPPLKIYFLKKLFLHLFYNSSKFLEQLFFG